MKFDHYQILSRFLHTFYFLIVEKLIPKSRLKELSTINTPNKVKMNVIAVELSIVGNVDDIENFINDFQDSRGKSTSSFYPMNCNDNLMFDEDEESCVARFNTVCPPSKKWLKMLREKYPSFNHIDIFWHNISEVGELGFIENDGTKYKVGDLEELKRACKLLKREKTKNASTPVITGSVSNTLGFTNISVPTLIFPSV
jgi:hypothetical protein